MSEKKDQLMSPMLKFAAVAVIAAIFIVIVTVGYFRSGGLANFVHILVSWDTGEQAAGSATKSTEEDEEIAYWTCGMHPSVRAEGPGICPVCKMELIPVKKSAGLVITQRQKDLIGVRTEPAGFHLLDKEIYTVGLLDYNERKVAYVAAWIDGRIDKLFVDFTGTQVRPGEHLVWIYSPELLSAQDEYLNALDGLEDVKRSHLEVMKTTAQTMVDSARSKLLLFGITEEQIENLEKTRKAQTHLTVYAPIGGTVVHKTAFEGRYVKTGTEMYKIADLSILWMTADIYEYEIPWIHFGQRVEITTRSFPGVVFEGRVFFIYPYLEERTRTVKVLVEVGNKDGDLKPGMYVNARLRASISDIYSEREKRLAAPYACPMHPWITSKAPGSCEICSMPLELTGARRESAMKTETVWTCPMSEHADVISDKPGECPKCGMALVKKEVPVEEKMAQKTYWTCPMPEHSDVISDGPGECPKCGMDLVEKVMPAQPREQDVRKAHKQMNLIFKYVCPDPNHTDAAAAPGTCPKDGKALIMKDEVLAIPRLALLDTGVRKVVFVDMGRQGYALREVEVGLEAWTTVDGQRRRYVAVLKGIDPGEIVVTRGNFLIDSQSQLTGGVGGAGFGGAMDTGEEPPSTHRGH